MTSTIEQKRHSLAHVMAAAVLGLWPDIKLATGPAIENGFYYDFELKDPISDKDLAVIQKKMKALLREWDKFEKATISYDEAKKIFAGNSYKLEIIDEIVKSNEPITVYTSGGFSDLCRGPHVESAKDIVPDSFALSRVAGAYWKGDQNNKMLTRIYGLAFDTNDELENYMHLQEEAKKRDHKKIGKELNLFTFSDLVGKGLPLYLPKGNIIRSELEKFIRDEKEKLGYQFVTIPHIARKDLYVRSGHLGKYDALMPTMVDQNGEEFVMKAMNCPHHFEIFNSEPHSYKELPLRIAENTTVYRNEKSGELSGLLRVKNLTQDDTHHFIRQDQIESEIKMIVDLMQNVYNVFGFTEYAVEVSVRDEKNKQAYFGSDAVWNEAEKILVDVVKKWGVKYAVKEGEAAFYGPKIDIRIKDAIGRDWQLTTIQLDFNQPDNFDMNYTGADGRKHRVVVLHAAIFGSFERFMGILIEHYAGKFPLWLSPVQVKIIPVRESHNEYAKQIFTKIKGGGIRTELDDSADSMGKKIRNGKNERVPYMIVVGDKEIAENILTVESRDGNSIRMPVDELCIKLQKEISGKVQG